MTGDYVGERREAKMEGGKRGQRKRGEEWGEMFVVITEKDR